jgi:very-short-patch-repair endonuclease
VKGVLLTPMRKDLKQFARDLRRQQTDAEKKLWARIRNRRVDGWKFNRQVPNGPYVLDFFCFEASLVLELDGGQHTEAERAEHDAVRTAFLEQQGLTVLRFWNGDVLKNIDGVLEHIYLALGKRPAPSPGALKRQRLKAADEHARRPLPKGRGEVEPTSNDEST